MYEIGALCALQQALEGVDFTAMDIYVGVSSGALIAAGLSNGMSPGELYWSFIENTAVEHPISPQHFRFPAISEYLERARLTPELLLEALREYLHQPLDEGLWEPLFALGRVLPTGVFDNERIGRLLRRQFTGPGRSNDFRRLRHRLRVIATDLDTGETIKFGAPPLDAIPISRAVQASAALPGLYPPVRIGGHYYVDGALKKTLHASVALEDGAKLVLCINPLVPYDARLAAAAGHPQRHNLVHGGLPVVLSQTFRALIHSRMEVGMSKYATQFPDADVVLFEPDRSDPTMFFSNVFSYENRRRVCELAYLRTRGDLLARQATLAPLLQRHGIVLRTDVLRDSTRSPAGVQGRTVMHTEVCHALAATLDRLEDCIGPRAARARSAILTRNPRAAR
jgi:NTE family protein